MRNPTNLSLGVLLLAALFLGGCAANIRLSDYTSLDMDGRITELKPPEYIMNKKKPKIAILPLEDMTDFRGILARPANEALSQALSSGTGIEIVERSQIKKLFEEARFKENLGGGISTAVLKKYVDRIDFVILGSVSSATVGASFTEASTFRDKNGKYQRIPPSCSIGAQAIVNVRLISTGSGSIYKVFEPFRGRTGSSSEVRSSSECHVRNPNQLAIRATVDAIDKAKDDFMDAFPNYGYVSKTMTNIKKPKDRIAFISLGRNDGLKPRDKLMLARYEKSYDNVKNTASLVIRDVIEVEVNETGLSDGESIVRIPEDSSAEIVPGYIVKTKADRNFLKFIKKRLTF